MRIVPYINSGLPSTLESLDLSNNKFEQLERNTFKTFNELQQLNLTPFFRWAYFDHLEADEMGVPFIHQFFYPIFLLFLHHFFPKNLFSKFQNLV